MSAQVQAEAAAPPDVVYELLAEPETYVDWEVGSSAIHSSDASWPEPGAMFEHSHGVWLVQVRDSTRVLASEPPRRLVLETRVRPWVVAEVELDVEPVAAGARITMTERITGGLARLMPGPGREALLALRNRVALGRLVRLAEARAGGRR